MEITFYHLTRINLQKSLPKLLEKILQKSERVVLSVETEAAVTLWNDTLWTYHPQSFLPHGTAKEGFASAHPIWITAGIDNPNGASIVMRPGIQSFPDITVLSAQGFQKIIHVFESDPEEGQQQAQQLWQKYKGLGAMGAYWQQEAAGGWANQTPYLIAVA